MDTECRGCSAYYGEKSRCIVKLDPHINIYECPCRICLVKGVCIDPCQKFRDYLNHRRGNDNE